jgi:hypothetical protein
LSRQIIWGHDASRKPNNNKTQNKYGKKNKSQIPIGGTNNAKSDGMKQSCGVKDRHPTLKKSSKTTTVTKHIMKLIVTSIFAGRLSYIQPEAGEIIIVHDKIVYPAKIDDNAIATIKRKLKYQHETEEPAEFAFHGAVTDEQKEGVCRKIKEVLENAIPPKTRPEISPDDRNIDKTI